MNMKPYGDLVLLKEQEQVKKSSTIIMLPGADGDYVYADVIKVGPGLYTHNGVQIPMTVKAGDTVMLHKSNAGDQKKVTIDEVEYLLIRESELLMVSEPA